MDKKEVKKRAPRLKSPQYRTAIGKKLREKRQGLGYSLRDIKDMTGISPKTVLEMEKGLTTNIDYYVEYAKAVVYNFDGLKATGIKLVPLKALPKERLERVFLTKKIRIHIIKTDFLGDGKTNEQIRDELFRLEQIDKKVTTSIDVAGVMRNLIDDETVKVVGKSGGKNTYALIMWES